MAVYLDIEWGGPFYDKIGFDFLKPEDTHGLAKYQLEKKEQQDQSLIQLVMDSKHVFHNRWNEYPKSAEHLPDAIRLTKGKKLPDYVHTSCLGQMVSQRLKEMIEAVEAPGNGYGLFPVDIYLPDDTKYPDQYYVWDVYRKVDAIDPSLGGVKTVAGPADGHHLWTVASAKEPRSRESLALKKDVIQGMVAWTDVRFGDYNYFIADDLFDQMKAQALTGFSAASEWAEI